MVKADVDLADRVNDRILLADQCGFDGCIIVCQGPTEAAVVTCMCREIGVLADPWESAGEYWVVLSWA